jgi:hypothetical protein
MPKEVEGFDRKEGVWRLPSSAQRIRAHEDFRPVPTILRECRGSAPEPYALAKRRRRLQYEALTQVILESTIAPNDFLNPFGYPKRKVDVPSTIAWNLMTAAFFKTGGRPWKIGLPMVMGREMPLLCVGAHFDTDGGLRSRGIWLWHTALLTFDCRANLAKPAPTAGEPREPQ